ncbi:MAG: 16S rRNA processing protein RimM [Candidatus Rokubacteria bacterium]|nr:16S rRNA processing protein RimM [Candidatus Rokubacteria bacterium]
MTAPLITLAHIVRPHGLRGEVKALPLTDEPAQLASLGECYLWDPRSDARRPCRIEQCRWQGQAAILALEGYRSIAEAESLVGQLLAVPEALLAPLPRGTFYASALMGARVVTEEGFDVGEFAGLELAPGHDLWVVRAGAREHLIPAVSEIVRQVDVAARRITIRPPEGLLELAKP